MCVEFSIFSSLRSMSTLVSPQRLLKFNLAPSQVKVNTLIKQVEITG